MPSRSKFRYFSRRQDQRFWNDTYPRTCVRASLQHHVDNAWQPLAFFSHKLDPNLQKLSTYDRELNAMYEAVKHFAHIFEGRHVTIFTDHKPLAHLFNQQNDRANPWQFRRLDFIAQFTTDIHHIPGENNIVADALSRVDGIATLMLATTLGDSKSCDDELRHLLLDNNSSLHLDCIEFGDNKTHIYCDTSTNVPRHFVPATLGKQISTLCNPYHILEFVHP